jgi:hypothetical protein
MGVCDGKLRVSNRKCFEFDNPVLATLDPNLNCFDLSFYNGKTRKGFGKKKMG